MEGQSVEAAGEELPVTKELPAIDESLGTTSEEVSPEAEIESGEEEDDDEAQLTPEELLAIGKKCLAAGDANGAVDNFQEACSILAEAHGQVSKELAEPYYLYGRALLDLAREKSAMFGQGIPVPEEGKEAGESEASSACAGGEGSSSSTAACAGGEGPATSGEGSEVKPEEEESDLQLSWEILELARIICQREQDNEYRLKLSDVNLALGEVGMECDQYEQAIIDLQSSLRLREFTLEPTDRRIAEVHFSLGLAHTLAKQVDQAIAAYKSSRTLLLKRKESLEGDKGDKAQEEINQEIKDLEQLIPDIDSKIADVEDLKKVLQERENRENEPEESVGFDAPQLDSVTTTVSDVTHLVRKRIVPVAECEESKAKRLCTDIDTENGLNNAHTSTSS